MSLILAPLEAPNIFANLDFWSSAPAGFDFRSTRTLAANTGYQASLEQVFRLHPNLFLTREETAAMVEVVTVYAE